MSRNIARHLGLTGMTVLLQCSAGVGAVASFLAGGKLTTVWTGIAFGQTTVRFGKYTLQYGTFDNHRQASMTVSWRRVETIH